jgi:hypothetical protein
MIILMVWASSNQIHCFLKLNSRFYRIIFSSGDEFGPQFIHWPQAQSALAALVSALAPKEREKTKTADYPRVTPVGKRAMKSMEGFRTKVN